MEPKGIDDPYNHGAYLGLERAVRELGIRGRVLTPAPKEGYVPSLSLLARQKYDLVIGMGVFAAPAIDRVATEFPETRFAIIDVAHDELTHRPKNVLGLAFSAEQAGYLAGHLAARVLTLSPGQEVSARSVASGCRRSSGGLPATRQGRKEPIHASRRCTAIPTTSSTR